jgi:putative PIN family toxin of toxin-antitoxin system
VRVALDTNVLVSAVATRGLCADLFNLVLAEHQLVVGVTVLAELRKVLRQKFRVPQGVVEEFEALVRREAIIVGKTKALAIGIRDQSDALVLAEAVSGGAEILVTGDQELVEIADRSSVGILTPRGFWDQLRNS